MLQPETLETMFARPEGTTALDEKGEPVEKCFVLGWSRRESPDGPVFSHSGSLAGTSTLLMKRPDGRNWLVLFNARSGPRSGFFPHSLQPEMDALLDDVHTWPMHDLFPDFKNSLPAAPEPVSE